VINRQWHPSPSFPLEPVLATGWMSNGPEVAAFEREFAAYLGVGDAVAVSSGAAAVELSLRSLRLPHGSRILISTLAPCSVVQAVVRAALRPVLVDVSVETGMPTAEHVHEAVGRRADTVRAMVLVHWAGDPADVDVLGDAAGLSASTIVEDAGPALGARRTGHPVGGAGSACFSFYTTAHVPIGEGGMVATDDVARAARLRAARDHGTSPAARRHVQRGQVGPHVLREGGLQSGLSEQSAATGRAHLQRLADRQRRRAGFARRYDEQLAGIPGVVLPHRPAPGTGERGWHLYPVRIERPWFERDAVVSALAAAGVGIVQPLIALHRLSFCREACETPASDFDGADTLVDQLVSLPMHPQMTDTVVDRVSEVLQATLGHRRTSAGGNR